MQVFALRSLRTDGRKKLLHLCWTGDHSPINSLGDFWCRPLNLINWVGWQQLSFNRITQRVIEDGTLAVHGGSGGRGAVDAPG
jgi:hypothetical protein